MDSSPTPLDWSEIKRRYENGAEIPTVAGGKTLTITGADDTGIHIRGGSLWRATLERKHVEQAAQRIQEGRMSRLPVAFVEEYHETIAPERGTAVAHVLKDLGYLD